MATAIRMHPRLVVGLLLTSACAIPRLASAQSANGTALAAVTGGLFGAYSGATLATVGSVLACTQTHIGAACVRWSAVGGGVIGAAGGVLLGASDDVQLGDIAGGAGIGFLAGVGGGLGIKALAQRVGWEDVFAAGCWVARSDRGRWARSSGSASAGGSAGSCG